MIKVEPPQGDETRTWGPPFDKEGISAYFAGIKAPQDFVASLEGTKSLDAIAMRRVVGICEESGVPFRTVPRLSDVLDGRSLPGQLKEVAIEDLLGRQPVALELPEAEPTSESPEE